MRILISIFVGLFLLTSYSACSADNPLTAPAVLPVPSEAEQTKSESLIKDVYKDDFAIAVTYSNIMALSDKLLKTCKETPVNASNASHRYVLFRLASDLASQAGDYKRAYQVIDEMSNSYRIDIIEHKVMVLNTAAKSLTTTSSKELTQAIFLLIDDAVEVDNYKAAVTLTKLATTTAKISKDANLISDEARIVVEVTNSQKEHDQVKTALTILKNKPDDATANSVVGKYRCFTKGDWDNGLMFLAKGMDENVRSLALKDVASPNDGDKQLEIADAWWAVANGEQDARKSNVLKRSEEWYQKSLPSLKGSSKAKAEGRISEIEKILAKTNETVKGVSKKKSSISQTMNKKEVVSADLVGKWNHKHGDEKAKSITLLANGKIDNANGKSTWNFKDNTLTLKWSSDKAPGGFFITTCTVSKDGMSYSGTNQSKVIITGEKVKP